MKNRFSFEQQGILKQLLFYAHAKLSILIHRTYLAKALEVDYNFFSFVYDVENPGPTIQVFHENFDFTKNEFGKERQRIRDSTQQVKYSLGYTKHFDICRV